MYVHICYACPLHRILPCKHMARSTKAQSHAYTHANSFKLMCAK